MSDATPSYSSTPVAPTVASSSSTQLQSQLQQRIVSKNVWLWTANSGCHAEANQTPSNFNNSREHTISTCISVSSLRKHFFRSWKKCKTCSVKWHLQIYFWIRLSGFILWKNGWCDNRLQWVCGVCFLCFFIFDDVRFFSRNIKVSNKWTQKLWKR